MAFDENNDASALGVTMSMVGFPDSFWKNVHCSEDASGKPWTNPALGKEGCVLGKADCRLSASLYNHKMMVKSTTGAINLGLGRKIAMVFNQSLTETHYGKCSSMWDLASDERYNNGCGNGAPTTDCNDKRAAWYDQCDGHTCTVEDENVKVAFCEGYMGGTQKIPECHTCGPICIFPGPALAFTGPPSSFAQTTDNLRDMAKWRLKYQDGIDPGEPQKTPKIEMWNEVVIDVRLLLSEMESNPAEAIPAIVYDRDSDEVTKQQAYAMRDAYCEAMNCPASKIPVLAVDPTRSRDPFVFEGDEYRIAEEAII